MEGLVIRGCDHILPEGDLGSTNPRLGFPHRAGQYRPGGASFRPRVVGVVDLWEDS